MNLRPHLLFCVDDGPEDDLREDDLMDELMDEFG